MTDEYLIRHATRNVWPSPLQDYPVIVSPKRISPRNGVRGTWDVLRQRTKMPTEGDWYHIYQIGPVDPNLHNLQRRFNTWIRMDVQINANKNLVDVYTKKGLMIPRSRIFTFYTADFNLIIAIRDDRSIVNLLTDDIWIKLYSNAYFKLTQNMGPDQGIFIASKRMASQNDIPTFVALWRQYRDRVQGATGYVDGYKVYDINSSMLSVGSHAEFVWDSSVIKRVKVPVADMDKYLSSLDNKEKVLVHYPASEGEALDQHYCDDVDVYLLKFSNGLTHRGVYYNKNMPDAIRMVTHRDYSLPTAYLAGYVNDNPELVSSMTEFVVELVVRDGGIHQFLMPEHSRMNELYKLPEDRLVKAMIGTNSNVDFWKAASLEQNSYMQIMRSMQEHITTELVETAYGYNAISVMVADTPQIIDEGVRWMKLPPALQANGTIYEYDGNGHLLTWHRHAYGQYYPIRDVENCKMIEGIVGIGSQYLSTVYGTAASTLVPNVNHRFYICPLVGDEPDTTRWKDVTGSNDYQVIDGVVNWLVDDRSVFAAVKNDREFLAYDLRLNYLNQVMRFTVNVSETRTNGVASLGPMTIQPAIIELWLNKKALIKDIDFFVNWPEICIVNKEFLVEGLEQLITIRARGFGTKEESGAPVLEPIGDYGFVKHGYLSENNQYDLKDDKVVRIVAEGSVYHRTAVNFAEDGISATIKGPRNGAPYQVTDPPICIRWTTDRDSYEMRDESKIRDNTVEDYLTLYRPDPIELGPNPIPRKYSIYSPFVGRIIYDFVNGFLTDEDIQGHYNDILVRSKLESYEWLLEYEPTYRDMDWNYVSVHPHNRSVVIVLPVYQYVFVQRAVKLYLDNKVDITKFLAIEPGYEHYTPDHPHPYRVLP